MYILSIDTSCDETAAAITQDRKVIANVVYSQVLTHKEWGGVVPSLAKRAHEEKIGWVLEEVSKKFLKTCKHEALVSGDISSGYSVGVPKSYPANISPPTNDHYENAEYLSQAMKYIDAVAVTYGPGLAIALEVGIKHAQEVAQRYNKKMILVNHMEGHLYSSFLQNSKGNPHRDFNFPYLGLLISGGHTEIVLFKNHVEYEVLGETLDDAVGESLDKAARMLGFGYPGGPVIERLAAEVKNEDRYKFVRPMLRSNDLQFSFSGLKTAFLYYTRKMEEQDKMDNLAYLASSFQEAVFQTVYKKLERAIQQTGVNRVIVGGGVAVNQHLRMMLRELIKKNKGSVYFPTYKYSNFDNAAMIGIAAYYRAQKGLFSENTAQIDRVPRLSLLQSTIT